MTRQEAQIRNWQKARLSGFNLTIKALTPDEVLIYQKMVQLKAELLGNWDNNSNSIAVRPLPLYKCWCGKRTNVKRIDLRDRDYGTGYLCKRHYPSKETIHIKQDY